MYSKTKQTWSMNEFCSCAYGLVLGSLFSLGERIISKPAELASETSKESRFIAEDYVMLFKVPTWLT